MRVLASPTLFRYSFFSDTLRPDNGDASGSDY